MPLARSDKARLVEGIEVKNMQTYSGERSDFVSDILQESNQFVQGQAVVGIRIKGHEKIPDLENELFKKWPSKFDMD